MRSPAASAIPVLLLVSGVFLSTGCGVFDAGESGGGDPGEPVNAGKVEPGEEEARETVASQDVSTLGTELHIAVHELAGGGETVELTYSITNVGDAPSDLFHGFLSADGELEASAPKLVDPANGKVHLVARDEDGDCVCSAYDGGLTLDPDDSVLFSATFGAPPEDVEAMNVTLPAVGTLTDVPLS